MNIRPTLPNDNKDLQSIFRDSLLKGCTDVYGDKVLKAWAAPTNKRLNLVVPERSFLCVIEGRPIAFAGWCPQGKGLDLARVMSLFVRPEYMRKGIGKKILNVIHEDIKNQNFPFIHLYANLNAVPFYSSQGYQKEESVIIKVADGHYISTKRMIRRTV